MKNRYCITLQDGRTSPTLSKWKKEMMKSMKKIKPEWDDDIISSIIDEMIEEQYQDSYVTCDNNYTHESSGQGLLKVLDWVHDYKPIIAGNGTFYENQEKAINPGGKMLFMLLQERKKIKKTMFSIEDPSSYLYKDLDNKQGNVKRSANSWYGASGAPVSAMYSKWSAPATTITAQSVISTCETTIEAFLGNNYVFIDLNECIHWMNYVCKQNNKSEKWIVQKTVEDVFDRIKSMFLDYDKSYDEILWNYISNCSDDELIFLYYKNNIKKFIKDNKYVKDIYEKIFSNIDIKPQASSIDDVPIDFRIQNSRLQEKDIIKAYNKKCNINAFLNPNEIPSTVTEYMKEITRLLMKYVYVDIIIVDKILRLKCFKRDAVVIVDTDSCIIQMDTITNLLREHVMTSEYNRRPEDNDFIAVNSMTAILTEVIKDILWKYTELTNISEDYRKKFAMKNEFLFTKLIIGTKKKRYMSAISVREGNLLPKPKIDCKGNDYMKSGTSIAAFKVFDDIVTNDMLNSKSIDVAHIRNRLSDFSNQIYTSLNEGHTEFLPLLKVKEATAYKEPYRQLQVRGALMWNELYPDKAMEFPVAASALKLVISKPDDIEKLQYSDPEMYDKLIQLFNHEMCRKVSKNGKVENRGLGIMMIPQNETIPDWCKPYIDYETVINSIICKFKSVTNMLKIKNISVGKKVGNSDRKSQRLSNIVGF